ncbi:MAG TPA: hypothetical protein DCQ90_07080 [Erysipelotrichaceae bacterium]|nr:DUF302 domain-containing protein [Erysipelotrichaceae bacterium]HAO61670.1 hypothetical protein [Erysipelotrichaceae bacterium]
MIQEYSKTTSLSYEKTLEILKERLMEEKFGVLIAIDLPQKFKEKGLESTEKFTILEVCNPFEAFKAVGFDPKVAYFLPCKLIVREKNDIGVIEMIRPSSMIVELQNPSLNEFALDIEHTLIRVIEKV